MGIYAKYDLTKYAYSKALPPIVESGEIDSIAIIEFSDYFGESEEKELLSIDCGYSGWNEITAYWQKEVMEIIRINSEHLGENDANAYFSYRIVGYTYN